MTDISKTIKEFFSKTWDTYAMVDEIKVSSALISLSFIDGTVYYFGEPTIGNAVHWHRDQSNAYNFTDANTLIMKLAQISNEIKDGTAPTNLHNVVPFGTKALITVIPLYRLRGEESPICLQVVNDL